MTTVSWTIRFFRRKPATVVDAFCRACKLSAQWSGRDVSKMPPFKHCGKSDSLPAEIAIASPKHS